MLCEWLGPGPPGFDVGLISLSPSPGPSRADCLTPETDGRVVRRSRLNGELSPDGHLLVADFTL
jgi:hypothetical protein